MPTKQPYADAYLAPHVTLSREDAATTYVSDLGTLPAAWVARLVTLRTYVVTCIECQRTADDLFASKLAAYRKDFDSALTLARGAQTALLAADGKPPTGGGGFFSVDLQRG